VLAQKIKRAIEKINEVEKLDKNCEESVFGVLKDICYNFSIKRFSLSIFAGEQKVSGSFFFYSTCPLGWQQHYIENKYYLSDPIFHSLQQVISPFEWNTQSFTNLTPLQHQLIKKMCDLGIKSGMTIPLLPYPTFHGFFTVFNQTSLHSDVVYTLSMAANICTGKIMRIKKNKVLECLTERERKILQHKSRGLTIKGISSVLGISQSTTTFHLINIRKKLGVQTTEHAVAKLLMCEIGLGEEKNRF